MGACSGLHNKCTWGNWIIVLTFQRVQDDYSSGGWTKHHTQRLEYTETNGESLTPSIIFEVAEPANDKQKDWEVTLITADCVRYTCSLLTFVWIVWFPVFLTPSWICFFVYCVVWKISCGSTNREAQHSCHFLWHTMDGLIWYYPLQYSSQNKTFWDKGPLQWFYYLHSQKSSGSREERRRYGYTLHACMHITRYNVQLFLFIYSSYPYNHCTSFCTNDQFGHTARRPSWYVSLSMQYMVTKITF